MKDLAYCDILTKAFNVIKAKKGDCFTASVFCFVSNDFDGISARIVTGWEELENGILQKTSIKLYDTNDTNTWQKLNIEFECFQDGEIPIYITFNRNIPTPFKPLQGHVIFAYPEYEKISQLRSSQKGIKNNLNKHLIKLNYTSYFSLYTAISTNNLKEEILNQGKNKKKKHCVNEANLGLPLNLIPCAFLKIAHNDPINSFMLKLSKNDTTYYPYKTDLDINFGGINLAEDRLSRWKFAIEIFTKEYNLNQKIFGKGFVFLNWYGKVLREIKQKLIILTILFFIYYCIQVFLVYYYISFFYTK